MVEESGEAGEGWVTRGRVGHSTGLGLHPACSNRFGTGSCVQQGRALTACLIPGAVQGPDL